MDEQRHQTDPGAGDRGRNYIKSGQMVVVWGLHVQAHLNGKTAMPVRYKASEDRWRVLMSEDGAKKKIKPFNLIPVMPAEPHEACFPSLAKSTNHHGLFSHPTHFADAGAADPNGMRLTKGLRGRTRQQPSSTNNGTGQSQGGACWQYVHVTDHRKTRLEIGGGGSSEQISSSACQPARPKMEETEKGLCTVDHDSPAAGNTLSLSVSQAAAVANFSEAAQQLMAAFPALKDIHPGVRVCVKGLEVRRQVNKQLGTAVKWNAARERWNVMLDDGRKVAIKPQNLALCFSMSCAVDFHTNTNFNDDPSFPESDSDCSSLSEVRRDFVVL
mmetsp:Transcript_71557/g.138153  ORF Transcript_71557/g.138153 Transcript_71557/m.138153 type:complete len:328 (+) Transcript_71557:84-1067(+)